MIAVQNTLPVSQMAVSMAFVQFCQNFGGTLWLSFGETAFSAGLRSALTRYAPDVSVEEASSVGVSGIRTMIPQASVEGVIMAYNTGVQHVFYIVAATAAAAFVSCWGLGWKSVRKARAAAAASDV